MPAARMLVARVIKDDKFRLFDKECVVLETKPSPGEMTIIRFLVGGERPQNVKTLVLDDHFEMIIYR